MCIALLIHYGWRGESMPEMAGWLWASTPVFTRRMVICRQGWWRLGRFYKMGTMPVENGRQTAYFTPPPSIAQQRIITGRPPPVQSGAAPRKIRHRFYEMRPAYRHAPLTSARPVCPRADETTARNNRRAFLDGLGALRGGAYVAEMPYS